MKTNKIVIKYIAYFIVGFLIFTIISVITQIDILKSFNIIINIKTITLRAIQNEIVLYTILYFLILIINRIYNIRLIKKLNTESENIRKLNNEKILKERREINMKRKVSIVVLVILLILFMIFIINVIRKAIILEKYSETVVSRRNCTNYYVKYIIDNTTTYERFCKDNVKIEKSTTKNGTIHTLFQKDAKEYFILVETASGEKIGFKSDIGGIPNFDGGDSYFSTLFENIDNWFDKLKFILDTNISTEKFNGKECYRLYVDENLQAYVNKEDMIAIKTVNGQTFEYVEYSFDTVTNENMEIPNLEEYTIKDE